MNEEDLVDTIHRVRIGSYSRRAKITWLRKVITDIDRYEHFTKAGYRIATHVYLTDEELLLYKLMFPK